LRHALAFAGVWKARRLDRAPAQLPILVVMFTDKCNLHCQMCGACDYSPGDHGMLTLEEWKGVIDAAARLKTQILSVTGGEAMLRRDVFDFMRYAREKGMAIHLNTNGLLLTEKNIASLRESGVGTVSISIESTDPAVHDAIRGEGAFAKTLEGLRRLRRLAPEIRVGLNCVINTQNLPGLRDMVPFAAAEGVHQVKFAPIHTNLQHRDKPVSEFEHMVFQETDLDALDRELEVIQDALWKSNVQSTSRQFFKGMSNLYRPPATNFYCYAGYAICTINAQGVVAACFDKDGTQNVRDQPLDEIWRSRAFHEHRQLVRNCDRACWDTTNAEMSLRLTLGGVLREPAQTIRDLKFYLGRR